MNDMNDINDKIKAACAAFDGYLHISASAGEITWHAMQCVGSGNHADGTYAQKIRSSAGHPTAEAAIEACLAMEWANVKNEGSK